MAEPGAYTLFDTAIGTCGIAWNTRGVVNVQLPRATRRETEKRLREHASVEATKIPPQIKQAIAKLQQYLKGRKVDLSAIPLHFEATEFHRRIYEAARKIPWGQTLSYGDVAKAAGSPGAARAVGRAMSDCHLSILIPCHRVIASGKKISGSSTGVSNRDMLLRIEGVRLSVPKNKAPHLGEMDVKKAINALIAADPHLAKSMKATGAFALTKSKEGSPFQSLGRAIIYQQLATKAAASIFAKLKTLLENDFSPQAVLNADDDLLRMAGLSRSKAASLRDLAAKTLDGTIPALRVLKSMSDEDIIVRLTQVRGIGVWSAQMFLMFALLRANVLPATDYGVQKGFQIVYGKRSLPTPKQIEKHAARWHPYCSIASWYMWRATDKAPKRTG